MHNELGNSKFSTEYIRDGRAPIPDKESVSRVMRSNKAKNTKPEVNFRKEIWKAGIRGFRLHLKNIPGRPDLVFTKRKVAVFINGCFWHRCPHCNLSLPKKNREFWGTKFNRNVERDKKKIEELQKLGWRTLVIWECEIKNNISESVDKLKTFLNSSS